MKDQNKDIFAMTKMLYNQFKFVQQNQRLYEDELTEFKRQFVKPLYPHKVVDNKIQKYDCSEICCDLDPGSFCCGKATESDPVYRHFGLGMCLYFKFMKHITCFYIFMCLLSLVALLGFYWVSKSNDVNILGNYKQFIFSSTIGSLSTQYIKCKYAKVNYNNTIDLKLFCPSGSVNMASSSLIYTNQSLQSIQNCQGEIINAKNVQSNQTNSSKYVTKFSVVSNDTNSSNQVNISVILQNTGSNFSLVSYPYECNDVTYSIYTFTCNRQIIIYTIVGIDLFFYLGFLLFFCSQLSAQEQEEEYFQDYSLSLQNFALKIQGFYIRSFNKQFNDFLANLPKIYPRINKQIVSIKLPESESYSDYQRMKKDKYKKILHLMQKYFYDNMTNPNMYKDSSQFILKVFDNTKEFNKYKNQLIKVVTQYNQIKQKFNNDSSQKAYIYLVLSHPTYRNLFFKKSDSFCCTQKLILKNKQYPIKNAPSPDLINWQNNGKWTCCRMMLSWFITIIICLGSLLLFGYLQSYKNSLLQDQKFNINCGILYEDSELKTWNTTLSNQNFQNFRYCYCFHNILSIYSNNEVLNYCSKWYQSYLLYWALPIIISLGFVVYNVIVSIFFRAISRLQGQKLVTSQLFSYTMKRALVHVMNMGIIMILLNWKYSLDYRDYNDFSFMFHGQYTDINAAWYLEIGSIIIFTLVFNIVFPLLEFILKLSLKCVRMTWDRKCCCRRTSAKTKAEFIALYRSDIYPIQQRYAQIISLCLITMLFSCVIPVLNVIMCLSLVIMQISDKLLIFKVYQKPLNYDNSLHRKVMKSIYICIILHMIATPFLLSQPTLLVSNQQPLHLNLSSDRIETILTTYYIIPYIVLLFFLLAWGFFKSTILSLFTCCMKKCERDAGTDKKKYASKQNFYECLSSYQLKKMQSIQQNELIKSQNNLKNKACFNMTQENLLTKENGHEQQNQYTKIILHNLQQIKKKYLQIGDNKTKSKLFGMPGYQSTLDDKVFNQQKNIQSLDIELQMFLK